MKSICLLSMIIMCGCSNGSLELTKLKKPVIIIAKDKFAVVLKSVSGEIIYFETDKYLGGALAASYNVGDTLK